MFLLTLSVVRGCSCIAAKEKKRPLMSCGSSNFVLADFVVGLFLLEDDIDKTSC